jgi:hypothetical protein
MLMTGGGGLRGGSGLRALNQSLSAQVQRMILALMHPYNLDDCEGL